ncbi:hypothetical protein SMGD1_0674 [Sulfurimonas gotlandica GD1]|uniref:Uncharacterized protein n=1 Tax=Sulfurimonas gotlandica (strain DSM 19862 / JCM 16533 / GD1) TaxID=929558 RepID=B6BKY7_SULGG|nr:hypothetical protein [Sulfurimonas gotlandica]EDZ62233.1 hypothetical protein CBGD1_148 [Sulfurimonas gotlandica GD1]EHP29201.1 hypothetical protein SMGD1_0674 [Sulfurimonas gotlandica GD1]
MKNLDLYTNNELHFIVNGENVKIKKLDINEIKDIYNKEFQNNKDTEIENIAFLLAHRNAIHNYDKNVAFVTLQSAGGMPISFEGWNEKGDFVNNYVVYSDSRI